MSIVVEDVFAERIARYVERNPDASAPQVMGRFLVEPTDKHREFVESMLDGGTGEASSRARSESEDAGGVA